MRTTPGFWSDAVWRVRRDPTTLAAILVLGVMTALAISADLLADHLFRLDIEGAAWISYSEDAPDGWLRVRTWSPARGYVERGPLPPPGSGEGIAP